MRRCSAALLVEPLSAGRPRPCPACVDWCPCGGMSTSSFRARAAERAARAGSPARDAGPARSGLGGVNYRQASAASPGRGGSPSRTLGSATFTTSALGRASSPSRSLGAATHALSASRTTSTLSPRRSVREQLSASPGRMLSPGRTQQTDWLSPARTSPGRSLASPSRTSSGRFAAASASARIGSGRFTAVQAATRFSHGGAPPGAARPGAETWSGEEVLRWLATVGLDRYVDAFSSSGVDGATLVDMAEMSDRELSEKFSLADEFDVRKLRREISRVAGGSGSVALASTPGGSNGSDKSARAAKRELRRVDGEWEMHFQVLLREKEALEAKYKESEARRSAAEARGAISATQIESYKAMSDSKLQLETKIARLEEDARRNAEDRREDKQRLASFAEDKSQRMAELKQVQQRLRDKEEEVKALAQSLTDIKLNEELVKTRAETVDQERLRMEKKLEAKEQDCSQLEKDLHGVKAQLRTQQLEYEAREEKIREMYEDALDEKEECEIRTKEHELKVFLLEEQLRADGQMPLTHLPEALTPDNSEEMDALRKNLKKVTAVRNSAMQRAELAENEVHRLENELKRMQAQAKGDPTEMGKLSDRLKMNAEEMDRIRQEKVRTAFYTRSTPLHCSALRSERDSPECVGGFALPERVFGWLVVCLFVVVFGRGGGGLSSSWAADTDMYLLGWPSIDTTHQENVQREKDALAQHVEDYEIKLEALQIRNKELDILVMNLRDECQQLEVALQTCLSPSLAVCPRSDRLLTAAGFAWCVYRMVCTFSSICRRRRTSFCRRSGMPRHEEQGGSSREARRAGISSTATSSKRDTVVSKPQVLLPSLRICSSLCTG